MHAVIMAGGKGTRFWPRSREKTPKHLLDIISDKTMIQETVERIKPLIPPEEILIVTGQSHAQDLINQLPEIPKANIIIEPMGRNTAPCIGLAALHIRKKSSDSGVMLVLPSDQKIGDEKRFRHILAAAAEMAAKGDSLLTIGISPTGPETGYGYVEQGNSIAELRGEKFYHVKAFREKPILEQARLFLQQGGFLWNSGMFIWRVSTILEAIKARMPELYEGLLQIDAVLGTPGESSIVDRVYRRLKPVSIDYGVMEKANHVLVIPGDFGWSDVGSWDALWETLPKDGHGNVIRGEPITVDVRNCLIQTSQKLVALAGVEDLIVVDTGDALLICRRGNSQEVRRIVEILEKKELIDYL